MGKKLKVGARRAPYKLLVKDNILYATNSENYSNEMGDKFKQFSHSSGGVNATRERGRVNAAPPVRP